ncbi:ribonucleoside reductase large subunit Cdc22, partial [Termitomyces sp. T32_za158]
VTLTTTSTSPSAFTSPALALTPPVLGSKHSSGSYLLRINGSVAERPQHMIMHIAVNIDGVDIDWVLETYNLIAVLYARLANTVQGGHAEPAVQLSLCFLMCMKDDSIEEIYDMLKWCAMISRTAGGIGLNIHCIRSTGCMWRCVALRVQ